jgi:ADP-heptose:LPS heptosyltransferase
VKRILLIRFSALGDVAMLAPVVREAAEQNKDCEFTVLSKVACGALFEGLAENVRFIGADVKGDYKGLSGLLRLFKELHAQHFDCVVDMHDVLRTKVLRKLFRLHGYEVYKINKHRELRRLITAEGDKKQLRQLPTAFENYQSALRECGLNGNVNGNGNHRFASVNYQLSTVNCPLKIGIAPFAAHRGKIYPLEKMEEVIVNVPVPVQIFLFGGGDEELAIMRRWAEKYDNVKLAADECHGLKEELELMKKLDVMVSMDSANMHLASLVGTRVVSIWGATHPYAGFLGWGQKMDDCVQRDDLKCRPCSIYGNKPCMRGDMACMQIDPKKVVERIFAHQ